MPSPTWRHRIVQALAVLLVPPVALKGQHLQSPIKLSSDVPYAFNQDGLLLSFGATFPPPSATVTATATTLQVSWSAPPLQVSLDGRATTHNAVRCHFHHPSEHWLDGKQYPFELHVVLAAPSNRSHITAVVSVLFDADVVPHPFLAQLWTGLQRAHDSGRVNVTGVDLTSLRLTASSSFLRYVGSLTTAPFTEGIEWVVHRQVQAMSSTQLTDYVRVFPSSNARSPQPRNDRRIRMVGPKPYVMDLDGGTSA